MKFGSRETFLVAGEKRNFPTHERIQEEDIYGHSTARNYSNQRDSFLVPTLNELSVDQILENAYSVMRE